MHVMRKNAQQMLPALNVMVMVSVPKLAVNAQKDGVVKAVPKLKKLKSHAQEHQCAAGTVYVVMMAHRQLAYAIVVSRIKIVPARP